MIDTRQRFGHIDVLASVGKAFKETECPLNRTVVPFEFLRRRCSEEDKEPCGVGTVFGDEFTWIDGIAL